MFLQVFEGVGKVSELIFEVLEPLFGLAGWSGLAGLGLLPRLLAGWLLAGCWLAGWQAAGSENMPS